MKVFVIQPNLASKSEVWLHRMNQILQNYICGLAAFITKEDYSNSLYPVFNLNGRQLSFWKRQLIRVGLIKIDLHKRLHEDLLHQIHNTKANVVLVHYATTAHYLWDILQYVEIPVFIYVHGYDIIWDHNDDKGKRIHAESYAKDICEISRKPNVSFIASSVCSFKNLILIGVSTEKIKIKIFGVELPDIHRDYGKEELQILFLGRFVDFKGPDVVLDAFLQACDLGFKGSLVMAGDGPLKHMCETKASRSKYASRISFEGVVTKEYAEELFIKSDMYTMHNSKGIVSNGYDTFGVTFIEAMSFGLPVITAPVGGPAEIIQNGVDGILVQEHNVKDHSQAFLTLFKDKTLRKYLGENGRLKVESKFSSEIEKKELFTILGIQQED